jgi:hypothetical protein
MARIAYRLTLGADGFETATILGEGADGLTRIVTRSSWGKSGSRRLSKPTRRSC